MAVSKRDDPDTADVTDWQGWSSSSLPVYPFTVQRPGIQFGGPNVPVNEMEYFQLFVGDDLLSIPNNDTLHSLKTCERVHHIYSIVDTHRLIV